MTTADQSDDTPPPVPAAQYVRMSTEHQQYSTENQRDAIAEFAKARGYEIVKTYADDGKSGLRIEGRESLRQMLADVQSGGAPYKAILVYDVSRWAGSRTRTRAPTTSTPAGGLASMSSTAWSSSPTTAAPFPRSSRA